MNNYVIGKEKVEDLYFDLSNPRLANLDISKDSSQEEIIEALWKAMDVEELIMSIMASGYFQNEPVIIIDEDNKKVVIEGNRRLAAVKIILDTVLSEKYTSEISDTGDVDRETLLQIPTMQAESRKDVWRYLGFKHVNGPAKWSSYAKSKYIARVHNEYGESLENIAKQIGDTHQTVKRLFRGLMVLEQAESMGVFERKNKYKEHFSFSHLYTGISYPGMSKFIGLKSNNWEDKNPVHPGKKRELGELCLWMFGNKEQNRPPIIQSQNPNLRQLEAVISNLEALESLREDYDLKTAFELTRPSTSVFQESLIAAKRNLYKSRAVLSIGYNGSPELLEIAREISILSDDLHNDMKKTHDEISQ